MKADKEDLYNIGEDMRGLIHRHPDSIKNNPDLASETVKLRDKWIKRYEDLSERKPEQ